MIFYIYVPVPCVGRVFIKIKIYLFRWKICSKNSCDIVINIIKVYSSFSRWKNWPECWFRDSQNFRKFQRISQHAKLFSSKTQHSTKYQYQKKSVMLNPWRLNERLFFVITISDPYTVHIQYIKEWEYYCHHMMTSWYYQRSHISKPGYISANIYWLLAICITTPTI